jgi:hypothetical protein
VLEPVELVVVVEALVEVVTTMVVVAGGVVVATVDEAGGLCGNKRKDAADLLRQEEHTDPTAGQTGGPG